MDTETPKRITPETLAVTPPAWTPEAEYRPWRWRNMRGLRMGLTWIVFPWDWGLGLTLMHNSYLELAAIIEFGPLEFTFFADIGNVSSDHSWQARRGLSETEAWDRSGK